MRLLNLMMCTHDHLAVKRENMKYLQIIFGENENKYICIKTLSRMGALLNLVKDVEHIQLIIPISYEVITYTN